MSKIIRNCTVHFEEGRVTADIGVLFRDDGWVRVGDERPFRYYPKRKIKYIEGPETEERENE